MRRIRSKDTGPELIVRRLVHSLGYRYRLHRADLPGKPDLVFNRRRKVIFVHGCFWHQHSRCKITHVPRSNGDYWAPKLARNKARDVRTRAKLRKLGWHYLIIWECETKDPDKLKDRLVSFLEQPRRETYFIRGKSRL
ncbi:MAG: DNA mismatch endonuclease Vsr [Acidobacteriota bacterium]|nr:DNA mismatch endonuclease Vsr [Acidobacteriota bacterium]